MKYVQKTSKGYWYFRHSSGFRAPLPVGDTTSPEFLSAYNIALETAQGRAMDLVEDKLRRPIEAAIRRARSRAKAFDRDFSLTRQQVFTLFVRQGFRCALTGMKFSFEKLPRSRVQPWAPSLDRLDSDQGYIIENVRLVTTMANLAKNRFGDDEFYRMCSEATTYRHERNGNRTK